MIIKVKSPEGATIESRYEGNEGVRYSFMPRTIEVKDAWLGDNAKSVYLGAKVLVPYGNITYIVMEE